MRPFERSARPAAGTPGLRPGPSTACGLAPALLATCMLSALAGRPATAALSVKAKAPAIPAALLGKPYETARAKLLAAGWRPDHRAAVMETDRAMQKRYPELHDCASDRPLCSLSFIAKNGACLRVITRGETLEAFRVEAVLRECDPAD